MSKKERFGLAGFLEKFGDEDSCREYLYQKRWSAGFVCPKCGAGHLLSTRHIQCTACRYQA